MSKQRIDKLRAELNQHNHNYYALARPTVSDQEYDRLMRELIELETKHPEYASDDSPSQRVGGEPIDSFRTVAHTVRMMSIDNTYNEEELKAFDERVRKGLGGEKFRYVAEPKVDGVAMSLRYEKGKLVVAITRGDGARGDDVTANVRTIRSVPLSLSGKSVPGILEVRGEVFMDNSVFQAINKKREEAGEEIYANPRNFTAGTLKQLDPKVTASRKLRFVAHGLGQVEPLPCDSYWDCMHDFQKLGFPLPEGFERFDDIEKVIKHIESFATKRGKLAYQTDGMVVKVDSFAQREKLGATSKAPRWVIAYKYPAEQVQTLLRSVDWQVGKNGTLTPVARLNPVFVAGTTVSNASLHNIEQIQEKDIHVGDTVVIEKAGEIIPYVVQVVPEKRPKGAKKVEPPKKCPSCGEKVEKEADTPYIRCVNPACPAQLRERLLWFVGRGQMYVEGLGESVVDQLIAAGKVKTFADLYKLSEADIANLTSESEKDGKTIVRKVGEKNAAKIVANIEGTRSLGLDRLLAGIGIRHVGTTTARDLAEWAESITKIAQASVEELQDALSEDPERRKAQEASIRELCQKLHSALHPRSASLFESSHDGPNREESGVATDDFLKRGADRLGLKRQLTDARIQRLRARFPALRDLTAASADEIFDALLEQRVVAKSVYDFFHSKSGEQILEQLLSVGLKLKGSPQATVTSPYTGKTVVITGRFNGIGRSELAERFRQLGAKVTDSVSANTDYLIEGEDAGSKSDKAAKLGVKRLYEADISELYKQSNPHSGEK